MSTGLPIRVVLAEDSPLIRERLTESLADPGRVELVAYAETENEAINASTEQRCDVLLLDLQLKEGNGLGVLKALRGDPQADPVVIVLTNYAFDHYRKKSMALGADYFFDKSRDYERVQDVLQRLADERDGAERRL